MLERQKIDQIAKEVATSNLGAANVAHVASEPTTDSEGRDALKITIIIQPDALERISGDAALDTLVNMQKKLHQAGEERFAILEYATQEELDLVDDIEP